MKTGPLPAALFVLVGLINLYPVVGVVGPAMLESLYGLPIQGDDLVLLMRHRAVLFGLLGALLIAAAFRPALRPLAGVFGLVSMLAFVVLAFPPGGHGPAVQRVFWADVIAIPLLIVALWLSRMERARATTGAA